MIEPYFKLWNITIYNTAFESLDLPNNSIDLIVTSPPYNLGIQYKDNDDSLLWTDYMDFSRSWMTKAYKIVAPTGRMCLNIPLDKAYGGIRPFYAEILTLAMRIGWQYKTTIVWLKSQLPKRTAWGSWMSASAPHLLNLIEVIIILYKDTWKKAERGVSNVSRQQFIDWTIGTWKFPGVRRPEHPAPFPVELPKRCMLMFSYAGSKVLDPFMGSGTTMVAAMETRREGYGVDISPDYCKLAVQRLLNEENLAQGALL